MTGARRLALAAALALAACGVKAPPRPAGAPDRAPPPGVFTHPAPPGAPVPAPAAPQPANAAPAPAVPCGGSAGQETCR